MRALRRIAYDEEEGFFYCEDGTLGTVFECHPLVGANETKAAQFQVLFQQNMPANTMIQVTLWTSPDIGRQVYVMERMRDVMPGGVTSAAQERAASIVRKRGTYLKAHTEKQVS